MLGRGHRLARRCTRAIVVSRAGLHPHHCPPIHVAQEAAHSGHLGIRPALRRISRRGQFGTVAHRCSSFASHHGFSYTSSSSSAWSSCASSSPVPVSAAVAGAAAGGGATRLRARDGGELMSPSKTISGGISPGGVVGGVAAAGGGRDGSATGRFPGLCSHGPMLPELAGAGGGTLRTALRSPAPLPRGAGT